MNELEWSMVVQGYANKFFQTNVPNLNLEMLVCANLPYGYEILEYTEDKPSSSKSISYETDLLIVENKDANVWIPRVVIECKIDRVTTHDAITYSEKAFTHKRVHPYLRYRIIFGNRRTYPLPGRLFRHGLYFDFMASWVSFEPTDSELNALMDIFLDEAKASQTLQEMIFNSKSPFRKRYNALHRPLRLTELK